MLFLMEQDYEWTFVQINPKQTTFNSERQHVGTQPNMA